MDVKALLHNTHHLIMTMIELEQQIKDLESKLQQCEKERDEFKHGWQVANELHEQDHGHLNELLEVINGDASIGVNEALRKLKARDNECIQAADDMAQLQYKFSHLTTVAKQLAEALRASFALVETGDLVRNTSKDDSIMDFLQQGLRITSSLSMIKQALTAAKAAGLVDDKGGGV